MSRISRAHHVRSPKQVLLELSELDKIKTGWNVVMDCTIVAGFFKSLSSHADVHSRSGDRSLIR